MENGKHDGLVSVKITNHPVLKDFTWEDIPEFALITGINGSGKTKLLEYISTAITQNQAKQQGLTFGTDVPITPEQVFYKEVYAPPVVYDRQYGPVERQNKTFVA